ncbi:hypothetical protein [Streptosporangium jomthongense]|uniref:Uncharacterized protein n=1 Tax=Streptosporangium jomthongense TaxID=1193683 RepID=A0ABV8EZT5_9ACTN
MPPISAGMVVLFQAGTYNSLSAMVTGGGVACLAPGAKWTVTSFGVAPVGSIHVRGELDVQTLQALSNGFLLENEGTVSVSGIIQAGANSMLINHKGATWQGTGSQTLFGTASLTNEGTIDLVGSLTLAEQSSFTNVGDTTLGAFQNGSTTTNTGTITVIGSATTSGTLYNRCIADFRFGYESEGSTTNEGILLAVSGTRDRTGLYISGTYTSTATGVTSGSDFTIAVTGQMTGAGSYRFTGLTTVAGSAVGSPQIVFYDTSQTGSQIFDVVTGTVTNVVRAVVPPPDPAVLPAGCAAAGVDLSITKSVSPVS